MAIANIALYRALKEAGASEESARAAARSVAGPLPWFWALTGSLATLAASALGLLWLQFQTVERLAAIEQRLSTPARDAQQDVEVAQRLTALEQRYAQQHAEIMQQFEVLRRERGGGQP